MEYIAKIWSIRYFWVHLSLSDLRAKWRRSYFGILWSLIQPLGMTALISIVFSRLFNVDIIEYAPYILSGIIVWEFVVSSVIGGSTAFVQSDAYIKQYRHPMIIYVIRVVLTNIIVLMIASLALIGWVIIVLPHNVSVSWLTLLIAYPLLFIVMLPVSCIIAFIGCRFRDVPHALGLVMQAIWFISPVYFEEKLFINGGLGWLVHYNPIYHALQLFRAPLLQGQFPTMANFGFTLLAGLIFALLAVFVVKRFEKNVIFYL